MPAARPKSSPSLHGNVPDRSPVVLLIVDAIGPFDFPGAERLLPAARRASRRIASLRDKADAAGAAVVYANDNAGRWRSSLAETVARSLDGPGRDVVERLVPRSGDYAVLKPKHCAFHATPLELLLESLGARTLVIAGFSTDSCVLATAYAAHLREFALRVPRDAVASASPARHRAALLLMAQALDADTAPAAAVAFGRRAQRP